MATNNRGLAYFTKGEYDKVIADYDRVIEIDSEYTNAYYNRGNASLNNGDYNRAIADYDNVIYFNPHSAFAYYYRGASLSEIGETQKAISDLEKALELGLLKDLQEMAEELLDELSQ